VNGARLFLYSSSLFTPLIRNLVLAMPFLEQIAADRGKPNDVGPWFRVQEEVGALRHFVLAQIRND